MNGPTNSWLNQFSQTTNPCISNPPQETNENVNGNGASTLAGNCLLWLVAGLILGGLTFQKKGSQQ